MKKRLIIGLTGPIASGKNTVAKFLARHGAYVIDADRVGHEVIKPQSKAWHGIVKVFGAKVLNRGGVVNRKKLGMLVFGDKKLLKKLDSIMHPEMKRLIAGMIKAAPKRKKLIVINAALLKEMKLIPLVDRVLVVTAKTSVRLRRLMKKGLSRPVAIGRMKAQMSPRGYLKLADIVIKNNGNIKELASRVDKIISAINPFCE